MAEKPHHEFHTFPLGIDQLANCLTAEELKKNPSSSNVQLQLGVWGRAAS